MAFVATKESISTHKVPKWYEDAKLGIFIHWGLYSVPAYATPTWELGAAPSESEWFTNNPYSEWYLNTLRLKDSPTYDFHAKNYGADFPYEGFIDMWKAEHWDPLKWASLFKKAGARYVIPVSKHHDGYCLWDSRYSDYTTAKSGPKRDIISELANAVRDEGIRFGLYYSGLLDWRFTHTPILRNDDFHLHENRTYSYADYAYNQFMELVTSFKPDVLWNDIGWPKKGQDDLLTLFAYYYNSVPEGLINDRWDGIWQDYTLREYQAGESDFSKKWENTRGIGLSFGYNAQEDEKHLLSHKELISLLVSTTAENGNLLINIGPKADGTIPSEQESRLLALGEWLTEHGEGIFETCPFVRRNEQAENNVELYFTQKDKEVFVFLDNVPAGDSIVTVKGFGSAADTARSMDGGKLTFSSKGSDLLVSLRGLSPDQYPVGFRLQ